VRRWRPDPAALKSAARAAIVMPVCFALVTVLVGGNHAPVFAAFGSFALLVLVEFSGRTRSRLLAYLGLAIAGAFLITMGTLVAEHRLAATAVAAALTFLIFFSGVINGYLAAARTAAVLLIVLPVMIPAEPSAIDDRLLGWAIACAIAIPAVFLLWRQPWTSELRRGCAEACEALARLIENPDDPRLRDDANRTVTAVRKRFLATPHRPTGPTGSAAAVAALIEQLGWTTSLFWRDGPSIGDEAGPGAARLRTACARALRGSSGVIRGAEGNVETGDIDEARHDLVRDFSRRVTGGEVGHEELKLDLARTFKLRMLSFSITEAVGFTNVAAGRRRAPGALGQRWLRVVGTGRRKAAAAERLLAEHINPRSAWLRNSVRGAIGIGLAVFVADLVNAQNAFWVVLGTLSVLRSNAIGTEGSVFSAMLGTVAGIVIGGAVLFLIGDHQPLLWIALPVAVLFASYASHAISFAAGQAGFSVLVMVLFNLIEPVGLEVGLVRIEDVAIGCAVSLVVGLMMWPRGARVLIAHSLAEAYDTASRLIASRVKAAIEGREVDPLDSVRNEAVAAADRLDAALRQRLDESSAGQIDAESLVALTACASRLLRSSHAFRMMVLMPWYETPPAEMASRLYALNQRILEWYRECAIAFHGGGGLPVPDRDPVAAADPVIDLIAEADGRENLHAALSAAWLTQALEYLLFLERRVTHHADRLLARSEAGRTDLQVG